MRCLLLSGGFWCALFFPDEDKPIMMPRDKVVELYGDDVIPKRQSKLIPGDIINSEAVTYRSINERDIRLEQYYGALERFAKSWKPSQGDFMEEVDTNFEALNYWSQRVGLGELTSKDRKDLIFLIMYKNTQKSLVGRKKKYFERGEFVSVRDIIDEIFKSYASKGIPL